MTNPEFSNEFDILASSYLIEGGFTVSDSSLYAFNEYEKSLFLTQAQKQYVISLYNGKNTSEDEFEKTEETRRYLHNLVAEYYTDNPIKMDEKNFSENYLKREYLTMSKQGTSFKSTLFALPEDLWFITYESVKTLENKSLPNCDGGLSIIQDVVPVTQDEFHRIKRNPFKGPSYRRALRLDLSDQGFSVKVTAQGDKIEKEVRPSGIVEIISKYDIGSYYVRYIKKVDPIILIDLPSPLTIDGQNKVSECKLHESVHKDILEFAVRLAIASRTLNQTNKKSKDED